MHVTRLTGYDNHLTDGILVGGVSPYLTSVAASVNDALSAKGYGCFQADQGNGA